MTTTGIIITQSMVFIDFFDFFAPFLSCEDLCKLAQTSRDFNKAAAAIEESLFADHEMVKTINRSVITSMGALCSHRTPDGERKAMFIPLPFGLSSKAKLRAIMEHKHIWRVRAICASVHLQEQYHDQQTAFTKHEELLFVTKQYSDEICKKYARNMRSF